MKNALLLFALFSIAKFSVAQVLLPYDSKLVIVDLESGREPQHSKNKWRKVFGDFHDLRLQNTTAGEYGGCMPYFGIQDSTGVVYWVDNNTQKLLCYKNNTLKWATAFKVLTFCGPDTEHVHHVQLVNNRIYIMVGCGWSGFNRETGVLEDGGND